MIDLILTGLYIAAGLIISELIYITVCKKSSKKEVKEEWPYIKFFSVILGLVFTFIFSFILNTILNASKEDLMCLLYIILTFLISILFLYINKKLGLYVAGAKR